MAGPVRIAGTAVAVGALATASAVTAGRLTFRRRVAREVRALFARSADARPMIVTEARLTGLPAPVQHWLRSARVVGTEVPRTVRLQQRGLFRQEDGQPWSPIAAEQYYTTNPPGFIWVATMRRAPLLSLVGRDRYDAGRGDLEIRLLAVLPVVHVRGPEVDQGELLRYLNEIMWFPAAALSPYITWEAGDGTSARATMRYRGVAATATFYFTETGDLTTMVAQRYRTVGGGFTLDTWATPISAYGEFHGVRVPVAAEAVWKLPAGDLPYARLRLTDLEYNRAALY